VRQFRIFAYLGTPVQPAKVGQALRQSYAAPAGCGLMMVMLNTGGMLDAKTRSWADCVAYTLLVLVAFSELPFARGGWGHPSTSAARYCGICSGLRVCFHLHRSRWLGAAFCCLGAVMRPRCRLPGVRWFNSRQASCPVPAGLQGKALV